MMKKTLADPKFMKLDIKLINPIIHLKSAPQAEESMILNLGKISVTNQHFLSPERMVSKNFKGVEKVWNQNMFIIMQNMRMDIKYLENSGLKRETPNVKVIKKFTFNICMETM